jgi:NAD(P)H-dependent FMN reductase
MSTLKIIIASTRPGRLGEPIGAWVTRVAREHGGFDTVEVLDLAEIDLPLMNEPNHPRLRRYVHPHTTAWSTAVDSADAFVIVAPEYNYAMNAPLKNALDYLHAEWAHKPVGLVTYGGASGGMRAAEMIKSVLTVLSMVPVNPAVALHMARTQIVDGEFVPTDQDNERLAAVLDQVVRYAAALAPLREGAAIAG